MIWIEMSRDEIHGGGEWGFTKYVWAPTMKKGSQSTWPFWNNILKTEPDDLVIHLRGAGRHAEFVGHSIVETAGEETFERPPVTGQWGYSSSFYRAKLKDFIAFPKTINLYELFAKKDGELRTYFNNLSRSPKNLFYVIQNDSLRCQNGAYFSSAENGLAKIILKGLDFEKVTDVKNINDSTPTSVAKRTIEQRIGQSSFSKNVKDNYNNKCCFPNCEINAKEYLIGAHIERWADNLDKRGNTSNGLCLCVLHDKAFEIGDFSIDNNFEIINFVDQKTNFVFRTKDNLRKYKTFVGIT